MLEFDSTVEVEGYKVALQNLLSLGAEVLAHSAERSLSTQEALGDGMWQGPPVIPALGRWRKEDQSSRSCAEFQARPTYWRLSRRKEKSNVCKSLPITLIPTPNPLVQVKLN